MSFAKQHQSREIRKFIYVTKIIKIFQLFQYYQLPIYFVYDYVIKNIKVILFFDFSTFCEIGDIDWYVN